MTNIKKAPLAFIISGLFISAGYAEMFFPVEMLAANSKEVADLSQFRADGTQPPGEYQVDIYLNMRFYASKKLQFNTIENNTSLPASLHDDTGLIPCLHRDLLEAVGVKIEQHPELMSLDKNKCIIPGNYINGAYTKFDFPKQRLDIIAPQASVRNNARGYINPELWDNGINAAVMNYNFNGSNQFSGNNNGNYYFLSLNGGINLGAWRLRDYRTWNYSDNKNGHHQEWQHINTYAERTVIPLRSNLVIGEYTTGSGLFDALGFSGVQLATDDNMYPDSLRGFSPVVRGMASGNAEVSIRQNGYVIYRTSVSPGAFEIDDLNPMNTSGDLEVTVSEANGSKRVFTIPYSSVPVMQREGKLKYSVTAGKLRSDSDRYNTPVFAEGTLLWGLPRDVTLYGGTQYSDNYWAVQSGAGVNMGNLGAFSADITHADSTLVDDSRHHGQSLRFLYAHAFEPSGTSLRLTGYRYSTKGFHTLDETALESMHGRFYREDISGQNGEPIRGSISDFYDLKNNKRARFEVNVSQKLGDIGNVYLTGIRQTYWNTQSRYDSVQVGYSNTIGSVSYFINYGYSQQNSQDAGTYKDHSANLTLSIPLNKLLSFSSSASPVYATFNTTQDNHGNRSQQAGLSGTTLEDKNLNWNISQGYSRNQDATGNAGIDYRGGYGNVRLGYSYGNDYQQVNYSASGGAVLHRNGLTFGQPLGETSVLIATAGTPDISIQNEPGVKTDWRGYTIKPYATAYRENRISVDTRTFDDRTDVDIGVTRIVPTKGAVVKAEFAVREGARILMTLHRNGRPIPFGATATTGEVSGIVGDSGQLYLSGMPEKGQISIKWGEGKNQQCQVKYQLTDQDKTASIIRLSRECQ
ncbi:fimbria/pilus outer membrane usher protein [Citrobacter koseri]|uniref:fimbria/pilus outer membrane usher protein n=1 Tax=Citrobacter koseri TaxID=545 RepID=UPI001F21C191|nr:fimbria/pilus outer membrane usher protein [Citrobacter koseri]